MSAGRHLVADAHPPACTTCVQPIGEFRDAKSRDEFGISGMCQSCQDEFFCDLEKTGVTECHKPCCETEEDRLRALLAEAAYVIRSLRNEARGILSLERAGIANLVSETNVRCLERRIAAAEAFLSKLPQGSDAK